MDTDISLYLKSWSDEFTAKANRVRHLIGNAHWLTDGHHKEELIKSHLKRYLPNRFCVTRGFVVDPLCQGITTKEIDILISDSSKMPPLLAEEDLTICLGPSVIGHVEVKTSFSLTTIKDAIKSSTHNQKIINKTGKGENTWRAIFFFQLDPKNQNIDLSDAVEKAIKAQLPQISNTQCLSCCLPKVIVVMETGVVFIQPDGANKIKTKQFDAGELSTAIGVLDLFAMISETGRETNWEFSMISESLDIPASKIKSISLEV